MFARPFLSVNKNWIRTRDLPTHVFELFVAPGSILALYFCVQVFRLTLLQMAWLGFLFPNCYAATGNRTRGLVLPTQGTLHQVTFPTEPLRISCWCCSLLRVVGLLLSHQVGLFLVATDMGWHGRFCGCLQMFLNLCTSRYHCNEKKYKAMLLQNYKTRIFIFLFYEAYFIACIHNIQYV